MSDIALEKLRRVSTATLTTQLFERGLRNVFIQNGKPLVATGLPLYCAGAAAPLNLAKHHAVDIGVPIACGVVIVPRHLSEEIAHIEAGRPLPGMYPPNEETLAGFETWRRNRA
ncbi:MAG TPA: hypothetical protein VL689_08075 [Paraburkholderia sp.]|nr:hypothetical protein [Paraburkholderia sp.]